METIINATQDLLEMDHQFFTTVTGRLIEQWQISVPTLIIIGFATLFKGQHLWNFSRNNLLIPSILCICVHLFRPPLSDAATYLPLGFDNIFLEYVPCIENDTCTWESTAFEIVWLGLAVGCSMLLNKHTKRGEKLIVGGVACIVGGCLFGMLSSYVYRHLKQVRGYICQIVLEKTCISTIKNDAINKKIVVVIFSIAGAIFVVPRALRMYKTVLRAILSLLGAVFVTISLSILFFVHVLPGCTSATCSTMLPLWITIAMLLIPALAFWGFIMQELDYANRRKNKRNGKVEDSDDENDEEMEYPARNTAMSVLKKVRRIRSKTPER